MLQETIYVEQSLLILKEKYTVKGTPKYKSFMMVKVHSNFEGKLSLILWLICIDLMETASQGPSVDRGCT